MQAVVSTKRLWTGRVLSGLVVLFLLMDAVMKLMKPAAVLKAQAELGWPDEITTATGVVLVICTILYALPQTAVLGAVLLTGYLGGAVASAVARGSSAIRRDFVSGLHGDTAVGGAVSAGCAIV